MSYDLEVYAPTETPLEKEVLTAALRERGWRVAYLSPDAFWNPEVPLFLPSKGPLEADLLLGGWLLNCERAPQFENLYSLADAVAFKQLAEMDESFVSCGLSVSCPYNAADDYDSEAWAELQSQAPEHAALLKRTRSYYYLRTSAARRPLALDLQEEAWRSLAEITGGHAENPQADIDWIAFEPNVFKRAWLRVKHAFLPGRSEA